MLSNDILKYVVAQRETALNALAAAFAEIETLKNRIAELEKKSESAE